jgi:hypothetical protein
LLISGTPIWKGYWAVPDELGSYGSELVAEILAPKPAISSWALSA